MEDLKDSQTDVKGDEDEDEEDVYGGTKVKRPRIDDEDLDEEEAEVVDANEDIDEVKVGVKRQRQEDGIKDMRKLKRQKKLLFHRYYSGSFFWKSSSFLMY